MRGVFFKTMLFVSHSFSFASTTYGLQLTPRGFWSSSQETPPSTFWLAPSSLFVWLMRFPSSPTTWPRWSSPKTAWLCWRDWGPWGFSVSLYCWCPGLASPHLAPDGHLLRGSGGGAGDPLRPCWDWSEVQMEVRRQPCVLATGETMLAAVTLGRTKSVRWPHLSRVRTFLTAVKVTHWRKDKFPTEKESLL